MSWKPRWRVRSVAGSSLVELPMTEEAQGLYRLMTWFSPAFPVGAYTYSHGIEFAVETGRVRDRDSLCDWVGFIVQQGAGRIDADLFLRTYRAVRDGDVDALVDTVEVGSCLRGSAETALESSAQGAAFLRAVASSWPHPGLTAWQTALAADDVEPAYAVAVAAAAHHDIAAGPALTALLQAFAANLISAGVRLIPLGQTDGQRATAALAPLVQASVAAALLRPAADLGSASAMVDWTSMRHETQYTRLFRS